MSPIQYIEARCDQCNDEIYSGLGVVFALLRNGKLVCQTCRDKRPRDQVVKNFSIPKHYDPEYDAAAEKQEKERLEEPEDAPKEFPCHVCGFPAKSRAGLNSHVFHKHGREEVLKIPEETPEPDAIDRAREEQQDRRG